MVGTLRVKVSLSGMLDLEEQNKIKKKGSRRL